MLAGLGVAMLVIAIVLIAFCIVQLIRVADVAALIPDIGLLGAYLYGTALACGIALIPPAVIAIYVAKHPSKVMIAIVMAIIALRARRCVLGICSCDDAAVRGHGTALCASACHSAVVYLIAALKIKRSL